SSPMFMSSLWLKPCEAGNIRHAAISMGIQSKRRILSIPMSSRSARRRFCKLQPASHRQISAHQIALPLQWQAGESGGPPQQGWETVEMGLHRETLTIASL